MRHKPTIGGQTIIATTPLSHYHEKANRDHFKADAKQLAAIEQLDQLFRNLVAPTVMTSNENAAPMRGIYLHGPVGRGKSFLMNTFYECLPGPLKLRLHFHRFMTRVHNALREVSGTPEPLACVADDLAQESKVLCFDEFFVSDIGDAMILYRLFEALFLRGVTVVATSNIGINNLYLDGLHRQRFEPAIELLSANLQQIKLDGSVDYRFENEIYETIYFIIEESNFDTLFETLKHTVDSSQVSITQDARKSIEICDRPIYLNRVSQDLVWFDFSEICEGPRSHLDYIELANQFNVIIISNVPAFSGEVTNRIKARGTEDNTIGLSTGARTVVAANHDNAARRFISLVDELYDQGVLLYVSAEVPLSALYANGTLSEEFKRTRSRLMEMQSEKYIKTNQGVRNQG